MFYAIALIVENSSVRFILMILRNAATEAPMICEFLQFKLLLQPSPSMIKKITKHSAICVCEQMMIVRGLHAMWAATGYCNGDGKVQDLTTWLQRRKSITTGQCLRAAIELYLVDEKGHKEMENLCRHVSRSDNIVASMFKLTDRIPLYYTKGFIEKMGGGGTLVYQTWRLKDILPTIPAPYNQSLSKLYAQ